MLLTESNFGPIQQAEKPDFKLHELCTLWSQASDHDLDEMVKVTKSIGGIFNDPATIWHGLILDGRNRQIVCRTLGLPFPYREFMGSYEQARAFVIAKNMARRHLTRDQHVMYSVVQAQIDARNGFGKGPNHSDIAEKTKASKKKVNEAIYVATNYDPEGNEEEDRVKRILNGTTTIAKELKEIKEEGRELNLDGPEIKDKRKVYDEAEDLYQDSAGYPVDGAMRDIWDCLNAFTTLRSFTGKLLEEMKRLVQHPAGSKLSPDHIRCLTDLHRDLDGKKPSFICPHCRGSKKCQCPLCKLRWGGRGIEDRDDCYCCQGDGYMTKDQPYPDQEWYSYERRDA